MKKTLLAAALLAGFASAAQAETSVTLYGVIDVGLGYNKLKAKFPGGTASVSNFGMRNGVQSGSRWGLRGSEDLGDGLRAVFQLENGFDSSSGGHGQDGRYTNGLTGDTTFTRMFGRHATLGLASDSWGQLDFGRQTNMASKYFGDIDPFSSAYTQPNLGHSISSANSRRLDNLVLYRTPDFSGFQAGIGYSFNTGQNSATSPHSHFQTNENARSWTVGVRYVSGPLNVAASYDQVRAPNSTGLSHKPTVYAIGASYDFEVVKVAAAFARTRGGWLNGQDAMGANFYLTVANRYGTDKYVPNPVTFRANSYMLGASAPVGESSKVFGSWQHVNPSGTTSGAWLTGDNKKLNVYSVGYTYDFSKRTNLYAYASHATNYYFIDGLKSTAVAAGLRHSF